VKRGDIIVFVREQNRQRYNYIWRVIGLPGDLVQTSGESLIINGLPAARERLADAEGKSLFRESVGNVSYQIAFDPSASERLPDVSVTVPSDHLFVMGDNRFNAFDSRRFGPIPFSSVIGKKLLSIWPNQYMKPTAPSLNKVSVVATTFCRGLSLSR
jgi:signal peptidase I